MRTCVASETNPGSFMEGQVTEELKIVSSQLTGIGLSDYSSCVASKQRHNEIVRLYQVLRHLMERGYFSNENSHLEEK